jgi:hypothetical protein
MSGSHSVAKGTLTNASGGVIAQDVWFKFSVTFNECTLVVGHNDVGTNFAWGVETFGSSGPVDAMSGPYGTVGGIGVVRFVDITELYKYGNSVTSITIHPYTGGGVVMSPAPTSPAPTTGDRPHSEINVVGLVAGIAGAAIVLGGVFITDRKRKSH